MSNGADMERARVLARREYLKSREAQILELRERELEDTKKLISTVDIGRTARKMHELEEKTFFSTKEVMQSRYTGEKGFTLTCEEPTSALERIASTKPVQKKIIDETERMVLQWRSEKALNIQQSLEVEAIKKVLGSNEIAKKDFPTLDITDMIKNAKNDLSKIQKNNRINSRNNNSRNRRLVRESRRNSRNKKSIENRNHSRNKKSIENRNHSRNKKSIENRNHSRNKKSIENRSHSRNKKSIENRNHSRNKKSRKQTKENSRNQNSYKNTSRNKGSSTKISNSSSKKIGSQKYMNSSRKTNNYSKSKNVEKKYNDRLKISRTKEKNLNIYKTHNTHCSTDRLKRKNSDTQNNYKSDSSDDYYKSDSLLNKTKKQNSRDTNKNNIYKEKFKGYQHNNSKLNNRRKSSRIKKENNPKRDQKYEQRYGSYKSIKNKDIVKIDDIQNTKPKKKAALDLTEFVKFVVAEVISGSTETPEPEAPILTAEAISDAMAHQRAMLPMFAHRQGLLDVISKESVMILSGQTGSGKTTQLPQYLYEDRLHHRLAAKYKEDIDAFSKLLVDDSDSPDNDSLDPISTEKQNSGNSINNFTPNNDSTKINTDLQNSKNSSLNNISNNLNKKNSLLLEVDAIRNKSDLEKDKNFSENYICQKVNKSPILKQKMDLNLFQNNNLESNISTCPNIVDHQHECINQISHFFNKEPIFKKSFQNLVKCLEINKFNSQIPYNHNTRDFGSLIFADNQINVTNDLISDESIQLEDTNILDSHLVNENNDTNNSIAALEVGVPCIAITQPRRVAAISVAARVAKERAGILGSTVGYVVRFDSNCSPETEIKFLTDGLLLREFLSDPTLARYSIVILDEAHERSISTDILFSLLKDLVLMRPNSFRLIIASATLDVKKFSTFFSGAPVYHVPGRKFEVKLHYSEEPAANYVDTAVKTVLEIHTQRPPGDVLVFLTGQQEIMDAVDSLKEALPELMKNATNKPELRAVWDKNTDILPQDLLVLPLHSSLTSAEQAKVFVPTPPNCRKVIIATNIAETSITIDNIVYVVDSGFVKQTYFCPYTGLDQLAVVPCSKAGCDQRAGRAGRVKPGQCFRLFPYETYLKHMPDSNPAEVARSSLTSVVLLLKAIGIEDCFKFPFLDKPSSAALKLAIRELYSLGAISDSGELTRKGRRLAEVPLEPRFGATLLYSQVTETTKEIISILATATLDHGLEGTYKGDQSQAAKSYHKSIFYSDKGDHITLLNIFSAYEESGFSASWAHSHFFNSAALMRAGSIASQLTRIADRLDIPLISQPSNTTAITRTILSGFFMNVARHLNENQYSTLSGSKLVKIHPGSGMYGIQPKCVAFLQVVHTSEVFMQRVLVVSPVEVYAAAPHFWEGVEYFRQYAEMSPAKLTVLLDKLAS